MFIKNKTKSENTFISILCLLILFISKFNNLFPKLSKPTINLWAWFFNMPEVYSTRVTTFDEKYFGLGIV